MSIIVCLYYSLTYYSNNKESFSLNINIHLTLKEIKGEIVRRLSISCFTLLFMQFRGRRNTTFEFTLVYRTHV